MSTKYYLQKVPVESVRPGFSLAIDRDGDNRLFRVDCTQMSQRTGQPVMFTDLQPFRWWPALGAEV